MWSGEDSTVRSFSTVHDSHNKSLGRASYNKAKTKKSGLQLDEHRMPPVIDFASGIFVFSSHPNSIYLLIYLLLLGDLVV